MERAIEHTTAPDGNIFADIGCENPEELLAKSNLFVAIKLIQSARKLTRKDLANLLGITEVKVGQLLKGDFESFSVEHLFQFLSCLDQDIEITIRPKPPESNRPGRVSVALAP